MFASSGRVGALERRVRRQEQIIRQLCEQLGVQPTDVDPMTPDTTERNLVADGKHILAIKHHRERTGSTLLEAKEAIEAIRS